MIAHRIIRGVEKDVPAEELAPEQMVLVKQNEEFPSDGVIVEGTTTVNEYVLTGEDRLLDKLPSSKVYAGSTNVSARVVVRVSAVGKDTFLSKLASYRSAGANSSSILEQRGRKAAFIIPIVALVIAAIVALLASSVSLSAALFAAASIMIVAAPPMFRIRRAYNSNLKILSNSGILVKDAATLEKLGSVDTILFDKTGILTTADITVQHVVSFKPYTQQQVLNIAAAAEVTSKHPVALTIVAFAKSHGASLQRVDERQAYDGLGVSAKINGKTVLVGGAGLLQRRRIKLPKEASEHKQEGATVIYVVSEKTVLGYIVLSDSIREDAASVIRALKHHANVVLLSGDHEESAAAIASKTGVDDVVADLRQANRPGVVKGRGLVAHVVTQEQHAVGEITITLGSRSLSDISILRSDLGLVQQLFTAAHEARKHVQRRFFFSSLYYLIAIPAAALGYFIIGQLVIAAAAVVFVAATLYLWLNNGPAGI